MKRSQVRADRAPRKHPLGGYVARCIAPGLTADVHMTEAEANTLVITGKLSVGKYDIAYSLAAEMAKDVNRKTFASVIVDDHQPTHLASEDASDPSHPGQSYYRLTPKDIADLIAGKTLLRPGVTITSTAATQQAVDAGTIIPITVTPDVAPTWTVAEMHTLKECLSPLDVEALRSQRITLGVHKYHAMMAQVERDEDHDALMKSREENRQRRPSQSMIDQVARLERIEFADAANKRMAEVSRVHRGAIFIAVAFVVGTLCGALVSML